MKKIICICIAIVCVLCIGFVWGKDYADIKHNIPPESGQTYKVYMNDNGEVLIRTDIKYITNDKDENVVILNESGE